MTLQRRHFQFIADTIAEMDPTLRRAAAGRFADSLAMTNPNFDRARFLAACRI